MSDNKLDLNNIFDPDKDNEISSEIAKSESKAPTVAKGINHYPRRTDIDPKAAKRAERQVATMFGLSALFTILFIVAYVAIPASARISLPVFGSTSTSNLVLGLSFGLAILLIGIGAIHWAKKLMSDVELVQERKVMQPKLEEQQAALDLARVGGQESGIGERKLIRRTLLGALSLFHSPLWSCSETLAPLLRVN